MWQLLWVVLHPGLCGPGDRSVRSKGSFVGNAEGHHDRIEIILASKQENFVQLAS